MKTFRPDSVAITCPFMEDTLNAYFRVEADLDETADIDLVRTAVKNLRKRFPTFFAKIVRNGQLFLLKETENFDIVFDDDFRMFQSFDFENQLPFRILIYKNRVSAEFFHIITDAHGGMIFLKTLLGEYYRLKGESVSYSSEVLNPLDTPTSEETADPFMSIYKQSKNSFSFPATLSSFSYQYRPKDHITSVWVTLVKTPTHELYSLAKNYNTTVGVLLSALYLYSFYLYDGKLSHRDIRLSVPVDLRKRLGIKSLRNFCLYATLSFPPQKEDWNLEKIISFVDCQMKAQLNKKRFVAETCSIASSTNSTFFKLVPIFLKKALFRMGSEYMGCRLYCSSMSNMGKSELTEELQKHIKGLRLILGEDLLTNINATATSCNNTTEIVFSSRIENKTVQDIFCILLKENGVNAERYERQVGSKNYERVSG